MKKTSNEPPAPRIADHAGYAEALATRDRLKAALEAVSVRQNALSIRHSRANAGVKSALNSSLNNMPQMTEQEFDSIALAVAGKGNIPDALMARLRSEAPNPGFTDPEDAKAYEEIRDTQRSVRIFTRAIALQEREIVEQKKLAIAMVLKVVQPEHERISHKIAGATLGIVPLVSEGNAFIEAQDEAVRPMLRPGPFPIRLLEPFLVRWISVAFGISEPDVRARMENTAGAAQSGKAFVQ